MVLLAVLFSRRLQTSTNVYLVNLSIADLLVSLVQPLQAVAMLGKDGWPLPDVICQMVSAVIITTVSCSVLSISMIAFNRYILITKRKETYQRIYSNKTLAAMVAFTWLYPVFTLVIPQTTGQHGSLGYDPQTRFCICNFMEPDTKVYIILGIFMSLASFSICVISYGLIYKHVKKHIFAHQSVDIASQQTMLRIKRRQRKDE